jgi:hypothetical protein
MVKQSSTGPSALSASIGEKRGKKQINFTATKVITKHNNVDSYARVI